MKKVSPRKEKSKAKSAPKNRYMRGAKISEYMFLKVLRGFSNEQTTQETALLTNLSEKRVRELYDALRGNLMRAAMLHPFEFGWAGHFLFDELTLSLRGQHIIDVVAASDFMRVALNRHAPRAGLTTIPKQRFSELLFEVAVRMFCGLSMNKETDSLYSDEIQDAYAKLQFIASYIHEHKESPDDPETYNAIAQSFELIMRDFPILLAQEEFKSHVEGYKWHRFSTELFYNDLRRYLLKNPIENSSPRSP